VQETHELICVVATDEALLNIGMHMQSSVSLLPRKETAMKQTVTLGSLSVLISIVGIGAARAPRACANERGDARRPDRDSTYFDLNQVACRLHLGKISAMMLNPAS